MENEKGDGCPGMGGCFIYNPGIDIYTFDYMPIYLCKIFWQLLYTGALFILYHAHMGDKDAQF